MLIPKAPTTRIKLILGGSDNLAWCLSFAPFFLVYCSINRNNGRGEIYNNV